MSEIKIPFNVNLSNEVVAITGGGGILMSAFAEALAKNGAKVAILDLNKDATEIVAKKIVENGGKAIGIQTNCLEKESVIFAKEKIEKEFGKSVTMLINGAGGNSPKATCDNEYMEKGKEYTKSFFDLDITGIKFVFDLNIITTVICSQVFAKDMVDNGGGNIINISSMNAFRPLTKIPAYSAAKAGVSNLTEWLAVHFAKSNIRVNGIAPGFFVTNQNRELLFNKDKTPTARTGKILNSTPMDRFGEVDDLIGTLLFLASKEASGFITGVIIPVDGGFNAYSGV